MTSKKHNTGHSVFQRLLNRSRQSKEDFNLILSRYGMERLLYRLSISPFADQFILKGASLFLVWQGQNFRVTKDADFLSFGDPGTERLNDIFRDICTVECKQDDGIIFHPDSVKAEPIMEAQLESGVRTTLIGILHNARIHLQIDIGFGDAVSPPPEKIEYPALLDFPPPRLVAYSRYTMVAEKLEIMVRLGIVSSRMKDFYDIHLLSKLFDFESRTLEQAVRSTFDQRGTSLPKNEPIALTAKFYASAQKQNQWKTFIKKSKPKDVEIDLAVLIAKISEFVLPIFKELNQPTDEKRTWSSESGWLNID